MFLHLEYVLIIKKILCLLSLYNILFDLDGFCMIFQRLEGSGPSMQLLSSILSVFPRRHGIILLHSNMHLLMLLEAS